MISESQDPQEVWVVQERRRQVRAYLADTASNLSVPVVTVFTITDNRELNPGVTLESIDFHTHSF